MKPARTTSETYAPKRAARLAAVQALYQMELSGSTADAAAVDVAEGRLPADEAGPVDSDIDRDLFKLIIDGAVSQQAPVDTAIARALSEGWRLERIDSVARAILRAGVVELWATKDKSSAVVISEFVEIAKSFFDGPEPGFINAALDSAARAVRGAHDA